MKKLISLVMALAMVFSLAIVASAETAAVTGTGTEEDPYVMTGIEGTIEITVPAATDPENFELGTAFLSFPIEAVGFDLVAEGGADSEFELSQGWSWGSSLNGVATIALSNPMMMGNVRITNYKAEELTLTLSVTPPPVGSYANPAALELGDNEVVVDLFNGYCMTWTAPAAGTFSITDIVLGAEDTEIDSYSINIMGDVLGNFDDNLDDNWEPNGDAIIEVEAYETVSIQIYAQDYDGVATTATISFVAAFEAFVGTENYPIQILSAYELGGVEAAAGTSTYYAIPGSMMGQIITIEAAEGMTVTFNGTVAEAVDGIYTLEIAGYPNNQLIITAGDADVEAVAAISYPAGSEGNPIVINPMAGNAEYTTAAGAATYFGIHASYNGNYVIIAGEGITVTVNGQAVEAEDGTFAMELTGAPMNAVVITNDGEADASYTISVGEYTKPDASEPEATEPEATEPEVDPVPPTADAGTMMPVVVALVAVMSVVALVAKKKELF